MGRSPPVHPQLRSEPREALEIHVFVNMLHMLYISGVEWYISGVEWVQTELAECEADSIHIIVTSEI